MIARSGRRGTSLLEMLVVMAALAIALNFGAILIIAAMRVDHMSAETVQRMTRHTQLADLFRDDVAKAVTAPDGVGEWKRSSTCLILQQPAERWVIYRFDGGMIEQITRTPDGEKRRPIPLGPAEAEVEFDRSDGVIILRIAERHKNIPGMRREIRAALGGDMK